MSVTTRIRPVSAAALVVAVTVTALVADGGANHQKSTDQFGSSGGNVNNISKRFCCSGTLGALVTDGATKYVLSNNHVLGRSDQATAGEDVSQPGLIDNGCRAAEIVADFTVASPLGSNVDAAIAQLRTGAMDAGGSILDIGQPSTTTVAPTVGRAVAKSGRTTGFTTGTISSVNTSVSVQYQQSCGQGKKFVVGYTNQVVISSGSFSAGGDSGSVIVTNDSSHNPVALLYAGSSTTTIGNPIAEVLSKLGTDLGGTLSVVGTNNPPLASQQISELSTEELTRGGRAKDAHAARLMADPSVFGVGVGEDPDEPGRAALVVYVAHGRGQGIAKRLGGVATRIVETDPIVAYGWNERLGGSCSR